MLEITPNYYGLFRCIADKCRHNCCIGWEIDVDEETARKYLSMNTPFGERIKNNTEGEPMHFVLKEGDRCPFLNENNLCEIITELGEDSLCEICTLHPRFRNFYSEFFETGLGLCCEEAARLVLSFEEKAVVVLPEKAKMTDEEIEFFARRQKMFDILQNREETILSRFEKLANSFDLVFDYSLENVVKTYLSLERLDEAWTRELEKLKGVLFDKTILENDCFAIAFEQLSVYFTFRHMTDALYYGDYVERVNLVLMSCFLIGALWWCNGCECNDEKMIDIVRMYSSEVEYSQENTDELLFA